MSCQLSLQRFCGGRRGDAARFASRTLCGHVDTRWQSPPRSHRGYGWLPPVHVTVWERLHCWKPPTRLSKTSGACPLGDEQPPAPRQRGGAGRREGRLGAPPPESRTQVCSAERPLWGLGPSEMTAAPRAVPGDTVPGTEGFPPCQIRWAGSCQPLSAGLRSTDESLQVSQSPPAPWPASWVARGSESISPGGSWDWDWAQRVGECQCPSGLAEPLLSEGSPVPTWTNSGRSGHAPLPQASRFILLAAQMCLVVMHP